MLPDMESKRSKGELKTMKARLAVVVIPALLFLGAAQAPLSRAAEEDQPQASTQTEEKVEEIDQRLRILERKEELDQEKAAEAAKQTAQAGAGKDGFFVKSADGNFLLKVRGYAQLDGRFWGNDEASPNVDTFLLRRVRPIFEGTVYKMFDFRIMPDFGEGKTVLQDAYMEARFTPWAKVRAGKYKVPFGLERLQSATDILFAERALPTNLVPNRDLGVQFSGDVLDGALSYAAGLFNGVPDLGSADSDINDNKEGAARLFAHPFKNSSLLSLQGLGIGLAATYGRNLGNLTSSGLPTYKTPGQQSFFSYITGKTLPTTTVASGDRVRISPQAYFYLGRFGLHAEHISSVQEVRKDIDEARLENNAWQVSASLLLTDDKASYKGVSPKKPFDLKARTWGAFEIAGRFGRLDVDGDAFPIFADPTTAARSAREWAAGVSWYLSRNVRWMLDYSSTTFRWGASTGTPAVVADREREKILFNRFQISF